jgi:hypothetical protein
MMNEGCFPSKKIRENDKIGLVVVAALSPNR